VTRPFQAWVAMPPNQPLALCWPLLGVTGGLGAKSADDQLGGGEEDGSVHTYYGKNQLLLLYNHL